MLMWSVECACGMAHVAVSGVTEFACATLFVLCADGCQMSAAGHWPSPAVDMLQMHTTGVSTLAHSAHFLTHTIRMSWSWLLSCSWAWSLVCDRLLMQDVHKLLQLLER
jgi:hypothetical protein